MNRTISIILFGLTLMSCSDYKSEKYNLNEIKQLQVEKDTGSCEISAAENFFVLI